MSHQSLSNCPLARCTVKKVIVFPVPNLDATNQNLPGRELLNYSRPGRAWLLVSDIPAGDEKIFNLFYSATTHLFMSTVSTFIFFPNQYCVYTVLDPYHKSLVVVSAVKITSDVFLLLLMFFLPRIRYLHTPSNQNIDNNANMSRSLTIILSRLFYQNIMHIFVEI